MDQTSTGPQKSPALIGLLLLELVFIYPFILAQYQYHLQCVAYAHYDDEVKVIMDNYNAEVEANQKQREQLFKERQALEQQAKENADKERAPFVQQAEARFKAARAKLGALKFTPHPTITGSFKNSLGMIFVPSGSNHVLFNVFDTTVSDFKVFVTATSYNSGFIWRDPGFDQGPDHPVVGVNWEEAEAFCKWLTDKEQKAGLLKGNQKYRLPTDAEWSVAAGLKEASAGTPETKSQKSPDIYPWGGTFPPPPEAGNYLRQQDNGSDEIDGTDGYEYTSPVGSFNNNRFGLYDMGGNVQQWCEDWYDAGHQTKVLRGACWQTNLKEQLLSSSRDPEDPKNEMNTSGFRCVLVVNPAP